jgi:hypothetical protein
MRLSGAPGSLEDCVVADFIFVLLLALGPFLTRAIVRLGVQSIPTATTLAVSALWLIAYFPNFRRSGIRPYLRHAAVLALGTYLLAWGLQELWERGN